MSAALPLARREVVRFFRQRSRVIGAVVPPIFVWVLIGSGFGTSFRVPATSSGGGYLTYFFPGTVVLVVLFAAIFSTISVIEDRREGFLQAVLVAPVEAADLALGKVIGGTALGMLQGAPLLVLLPFLGLARTGARFAGAVGVLLLLCFALTSLGFAIAWSLDSTQGFHTIMNLFLIPMWLLSGAFFPLNGAPAWLRAAMRLNPLTYGMAVLRRLVQPGAAAELPAAGLSLAVTVAFGGAMFVLATLLVVKSPSGPGSRRRRAGGLRR